MSALCTEGCGRMTNEKDRVCVPCKKFGVSLLEATAENIKSRNREIKSKETAMSKTGIKICVDCKKDYKPTSNAQERCDPCREIHKKNKADAYRKKHSPKKKSKSASSITSGRSNEGRSTGSPLQSEIPSNGRYTVEVDFSNLPKLHEQLLTLAGQELRTPGNQLLYYLRQEFNKLEKDITA